MGSGGVRREEEEGGDVGIVVEEFGNWEVHRIICESRGIGEAVGSTNATMKDFAFKAVNNLPVAEEEKGEEEGEIDTSTGMQAEESITLTVTATAPTSANEGVVSIQTILADPNLQPNPETTQLPELGQKGTESPHSESSREEQKKPEDMKAWEYEKWKAEKLRITLEKWWEGVWVRDD